MRPNGHTHPTLFYARTLFHPHNETALLHASSHRAVVRPGWFRVRGVRAAFRDSVFPGVDLSGVRSWWGGGVGT